VEEGTVATEEKKYEGIGGWLILVGAGLTFALLKSAYFIFTTYPPFFTNGILMALITSDSGTYNLSLAILVTAELIMNLGLLLSFGYLVYLFMKRRAQFRVWFIGVMAFNLVFMILDPSVIKVIMPGHKAFDDDVIMSIARSAGGCLIWIPYMLKSKRVKATFTQ
jgi:hypothetical protein